MWVRRLPVGLIVPALLVGLVAVLATLQYRWLGKVSEAEREQLRRSLDQRAREFTDDFDLEISRIYLSLEVSQEEIAANEWSRFAAAVDRWRQSARFPQLVRGIYLAEGERGRQAVRRYDAQARTFGQGMESWPRHLEAIRAQLGGGALARQSVTGGQTRIVAITITPVVSDVPALLIPVAMPPSPASAEAGPAAGRIRLQWPGSYLVVDLDGDYLRQTIVPVLVSRHFPEQGADGYRIAVLSAAGTAVFARGVPPGASIDPVRADVVAPFFGLRLDVARDLLPAADALTFRSMVGPPGAAGTLPAPGRRVAVFVEHRAETAGGTAATARLRVPRPGWRIVLSHASGSLDAAVSQARRRNLWLSFSILAVLAAGVVLVVVNARRSAQLAARQMDFVATVSHELRTPLAVIRSAAQNLSAGVVAEPARAKRYGDLIEDEGRRLTEMVEQVLEYARIGGNRALRRPRPVDVRSLVGDVRAACLEACVQAGVTLDVGGAAGDALQVTADEAALGRALQNLVTNAAKHAAEGQSIRIDMGSERLRRRAFVWISVADRGPGIEAHDIAHIFEPFYRGRQAVDRQVHGNGLGLSLVKRVAESHGGSVSVKSVVGEGTVFTLHLPATPPAAAAPSGAGGADFAAEAHPVGDGEPRPGALE